MGELGGVHYLLYVENFILKHSDAESNRKMKARHGFQKELMTGIFCAKIIFA
jgi:hypothetical protein